MNTIILWVCCAAREEASELFLGVRSQAYASLPRMAWWARHQVSRMVRQQKIPKNLREKRERACVESVHSYQLGGRTKVADDAPDAHDRDMIHFTTLDTMKIFPRSQIESNQMNSKAISSLARSVSILVTILSRPNK